MIRWTWYEVYGSRQEKTKWDFPFRFNFIFFFKIQIVF